MGKITNEEIIKERIQEMEDLNIDICIIEDKMRILESDRDLLIFKFNNIENEIQKLRENISYIK